MTVLRFQTKNIKSFFLQKIIVIATFVWVMFGLFFWLNDYKDLNTNSSVSAAVNNNLNSSKSLSVTANQDSINTVYSSVLLPVPQQVSFTKNTFKITGSWVVVNNEPAKNKAAIISLLTGLQKQGLTVKQSDNNNVLQSIKLVVKEGSVGIGETIDTNRVALQNQAYQVNLNASSITIKANTSQGLYYGVQTLLQLVKTQKENGLLPQGEVTDWPNVNIRMIYWDDAHHLEKMAALKRIISQAAYFKINAFSIKLEGHFQYKSAPAIVEPYALSVKEYQELTDFAKAHFVELVPYLDAPAHVSFILKHPEYKALRLFENNNYQFTVTNPETEKLVDAMFTDLINANKGGHYVLLSNDEAYYTGKSKIESGKAKELGGNGKLLAWFVKRIADNLHKQGRTALFWGEFPLTENDISDLPCHLVNGVYNKDIAARFKQHGMRQFVYTATQGAEPVFPNYYPLHTKTQIMEDGSDRSSGRVNDMLNEIGTAFEQNLSSFMGVIVAGWADAGLHPETFWLGYAAGASAGWNNKGVTAADVTNRFYRSFYGPATIQMDSVYRLLSTQAEFYDQSWDWVSSVWRKPILGNSDSVFTQPQPAKDQTLLMLPVPSANTLALVYDWDTANDKRLESATEFLQQNEHLQQLINANKKALKDQQYNLEVLESVATLCEQNLQMLLLLKQVNDLLKSASNNASINSMATVQNIDTALATVATIKAQRDNMLANVKKVWFKEWQPLIAEANGRRFLHEIDDIKDHQPGRTIDLSYLIYRQLHYPLQKWIDDVIKVRNDYAAKHDLSQIRNQLRW